MDPASPGHVFASPITAARGRAGGDTVRVTLPDGRSALLSRSAAERSAALLTLTLAALADEAAASPSRISRLEGNRIVAGIRPLQRNVQRARLAWTVQCRTGRVPTRWLVAAMLLPLAFAVLAAVAAVPLALGAGWAIALVGAALVAITAPLAAWHCAGRMMTEDEMRPARRAFRPMVVASGG